jgi:flagellar FliL protein
MKFSKTFTVFFMSLFLFASLLPLQQASAAEHGGKDGESAYIKLEPFTVNLADLSQYLQIGLTLQGGSPEAGAAIVMLMPKVRHEMILLLSGQEAAEILSPQGKVKLAEEIKQAINNVIELSGKHGVTGVLFVSFIVQ